MQKLTIVFHYRLSTIWIKEKQVYEITFSIFVNL